MFFGALNNFKNQLFLINFSKLPLNNEKYIIILCKLRHITVPIHKLHIKVW
jgi:hypothetical protein